MARPTITPTGREVSFGDDEIIVSKTDRKGILTYANDVFLRVAGYTEQEVIGQPHNIIRHPDMPSCVFDMLWSTIASGNEIFAYVVNLTKSGDHYWVLAHVTPSFDTNGQIVGYHSSRRVPEKRIMPIITELYAALRAEERRHASPKDGLAASKEMVTKMLAEKGQAYDEFIHHL